MATVRADVITTNTQYRGEKPDVFINDYPGVEARRINGPPCSRRCTGIFEVRNKLSFRTF